MNEIKIRKATLDDVEAISTIKVEGWQSAYKNIISELSKLNKKVVAINRKINRCLANAKTIPKKNIRQLEENSKGLSKNCQELEHYVNAIRVLREELINTSPIFQSMTSDFSKPTASFTFLLVAMVIWIFHLRTPQYNDTQDGMVANHR